MKKWISEAIWFAKTSWSYLGCDEGSGRWKARRKFFAGIVPETLAYCGKMRQP